MNQKKIRIRYYPPSWFQMLYQNIVIYIDPSYMKTLFTKYFKELGCRDIDPFEGLPSNDMPKADIVLLTHNHADHCNGDTIGKLLKEETIVLGPKSCLKKLAINISTIEPGEVINLKDIVIRAIPSYNTPEGKSTRKVHKYGECNGYILDINNKTIYHAGDTDYIPEMNELKNKIDLALIPIGGSSTLDTEEAIEAVLHINPKVVIPMHFKKSGKPILFKKEIQAKSNIDAVVLDIGEEYFL